MVKDFVVSAEMVQVNRAKSLVQEGDDKLNRQLRQSWQPYKQALEIWYQSENIVIRNSQFAASACDDTADSALETAHHVRTLLEQAVVGKEVGISEFCEV